MGERTFTFGIDLLLENFECAWNLQAIEFGRWTLQNRKMKIQFEESLSAILFTEHILFKFGKSFDKWTGKNL